MSDVDWRNPYGDGRGEWLRGNLHAHTSPASACGRIPVEDMLDRHARARRVARLESLGDPSTGT